MSAPPISGIGSGLWVPTPIATEWKAGSGKLGNRAPEKAAKAGLKLTEFAKLWPTPTVCGNYNRKGASKTSGDGLATAVANAMWPTPTSSLGTKGGRVTPRKSREGGTLIEAVSARTFATPTARNWRSGKASQATHDRNSRPLSEQVGGLLNPDWVELIMGWLKGWTALQPLPRGPMDGKTERPALPVESPTVLTGSEPSETAKSPSVQQQRGECLQEAEA